MPRLTAIVPAGDQRARAQRCVDALLQQTARDDLEILVVDVAPETTAALGFGDDVRLLRAPGAGWGQTRRIGVQSARGEIVAFVEDHCVPDRDWAAALIRAYKEPWDAVGYAFRNANPGSYVSAACLLTDYGLWLTPAHGGAARYLPSNNVSYRRSVLAGLEEELATVFALDTNLHEELVRQRKRLGIEPTAIVAHENFERLIDVMRANHDFCRLMAAHRVASGRWGPARRVVYGVAAPVAAPAIKLRRLIVSLRGRGHWRAFAKSLPVLLPTYAWAAIGESAGYLTARGSDGALLHWETRAKRARR